LIVIVIYHHEDAEFRAPLHVWLPGERGSSNTTTLVQRVFFPGAPASIPLRRPGIPLDHLHVFRILQVFFRRYWWRGDGQGLLVEQHDVLPPIRLFVLAQLAQLRQFLERSEMRL